MSERTHLKPFHELTPKERVERYKKAIKKISETAPPIDCYLTDEELMSMRSIRAVKGGADG